MPYYIKIRDKAFGPLDEEELLAMKTQGKLTKMTEISENKSEWFFAESLDFLFPRMPLGSLPTEFSPAASAQEPAEWYYSLDGKAGFGPMTRSAIVHMLKAGTLQGNSLVWKQGQGSQQVQSIPEFSGQGGTPFQASPPRTGTSCPTCGNPFVGAAAVCPQCGTLTR